MTEKNTEQVNEQEEKIDQAETNETEDIETIELVDDTDQEIVDESVDDKFEQLLTEKDELFNKFVRLQAEYDNFRKRTQREKAADLKYKSQALVTNLLPVLDDFERALTTASDDESIASFVDGIKIIYRQLNTVIETEGVEVIEAVGEVFDPNLHQAVVTVNDDQYEENVVVEVLQKGYQLKDRVLRPAMVKVNQ